MSNRCAKKKIIQTFLKANIDKISIFQEIAPNFTYSQKLLLFNLRPTAHTLYIL